MGPALKINGQELIVTTPEQLQEMVRQAVRAEMGAGPMGGLQYLTLRQVAEMFGKSTRTIRNWVRDRGLPAKTAGVDLRFEVAAVRAWLDANPARATNPRGRTALKRIK